MKTIKHATITQGDANSTVGELLHAPNPGGSEKTSAVLEEVRQINIREDVRGLLFRLLLTVVKEREPKVADVLEGRVALNSLAAETRIPALQATGIWFQLLAVADEILGMRSRRALEQAGSADDVVGSFANVIGEIAARATPPKRFKTLWTCSRSARP